MRIELELWKLKTKKNATEDRRKQKSTQFWSFFHKNDFFLASNDIMCLTQTFINFKAMYSDRERQSAI